MSRVLRVPQRSQRYSLVFLFSFPTDIATFGRLNLIRPEEDVFRPKESRFDRILSSRPRPIGNRRVAVERDSPVSSFSYRSLKSPRLFSPPLRNNFLIVVAVASMPSFNIFFWSLSVKKRSRQDDSSFFYKKSYPPSATVMFGEFIGSRMPSTVEKLDGRRVSMLRTRRDETEQQRLLLQLQQQQQLHYFPRHLTISVNYPRHYCLSVFFYFFFL